MPGSFLSSHQLAIIPGARFKFESVPRSLMTVGIRGISTLMIPLDWGAEDAIIPVFIDEYLNGNSNQYIGFNAWSTDANKLLTAMFQGAYKVLVKNANQGGTKATATLGAEAYEVTLTARHQGIGGNKIRVATVDREDGSFNVITYFDNVEFDRQRAVTWADVVDNSYVIFPETGVIVTNSGIPFTGGTNGTYSATTAWPAYLSLLTTETFQTIAFTETEPALKTNFLNWIEDMRERQGRLIVGVAADFAAADYEGIISVGNSLALDNVDFTATELTALIAGLSAGANLGESLTGFVIRNATRIINPMKLSDIEAALEAGNMVFQARDNGDIEIVQDINTFTTTTPQKNYEFRKNLVIRTRDEIQNSISRTFNASYKGKVKNNETGRRIFDQDINSYLDMLVSMECLEAGAENRQTSVVKGARVDIMLATIQVVPIDCVEFVDVTVRFAL